MIDLEVTPLDAVELQVTLLAQDLGISPPASFDLSVSVLPAIQISVLSNPAIEVVQMPASTIQIGLLSEDADQPFLTQSIVTSFAYGDASPKPIAVLTPNQTVFTATIVIQSPFNGVGAMLTLGDATLANRLIQSNQVDPFLVSEFQTNPGYTYSSSDSVLLFITPGEGCTQGSGYVLLEVS